MDSLERELKANSKGHHSPAIVPASLANRFGAFFIDKLILIVTTTILSMYFAPMKNGLEKYIVAASLVFLLQIYFYSKSQSIGKWILGMHVVDTITKKKLSFPKMLLRELIGKGIINKLCFGMGFVLIFFTDRNEAVWDKMCKSVVVDIY